MKTVTLFLLNLFILLGPVSAHAKSTILVFNGTGSSPNDVMAIGQILTSMGLSYDTANSAQMNAMTKATLLTYRLIVWPGGNSITMGASLTTYATSVVRQAVVAGVSYLGFCAGAFMAESSNLYNVFHLAPTWFDFYRQGATDMVTTTFADGAKRSLVYWDGPHLKGFGTVIAKYPNGLPAISAAPLGKGFVLLSGVHPEAPADWRYGFASPDIDGVDADIVLTKELIQSALNKYIYPHY